MLVTQAANDLIKQVEGHRQAVSERLDGEKRGRLGQFFTPSPVAQFIASLPLLPSSGRVRILDPGAGNGALTAALVSRIATERPDLVVDVTAFEIDEALRPELDATLDGCRRLARRAGLRLTTGVRFEDFLEWAASSILMDRLFPSDERFDIVIMNPPYRKVNVTAPERRVLKTIGVEITNLYVAFIVMSVALLDKGGQIAAITPRSFTNGPYFRSFRRYFFDRMAFDRVHVYESREKAFAGEAVLQENIIFAAHRAHPGKSGGTVTISTSFGPDDSPRLRTVPHNEIVDPSDQELFVHIMIDEADAALGRILLAFPTRLSMLSLEVSTGRVVDFRAKEHLRYEPEPSAVPLLYPGHLRNGAIVWPGDSRRKPSWIASCRGTAPFLLPADTYILVKRFTAKEERRRVVAAVFDSGDVPDNVVGFENHLNVFHINGHGLPTDLARGLAAWLNSTVVDRYVRCFNGHTQINATDLRCLPYPTESELRSLGGAMGETKTADQDKIDALVSVHVAELRDIAA